MRAMLFISSMLESLRLPLTVLGICLQLFGFILMLVATRIIKSRNAGFTSDFSGVPNVMTMVHGKYNQIGISFVISGSICQLITVLPL